MRVVEIGWRWAITPIAFAAELMLEGTADREVNFFRHPPPAEVADVAGIDEDHVLDTGQDGSWRGHYRGNVRRFGDNTHPEQGFRDG